MLVGQRTEHARDCFRLGTEVGANHTWQRKDHMSASSMTFYNILLAFYKALSKGSWFMIFSHLIQCSACVYVSPWKYPYHGCYVMCIQSIFLLACASTQIDQRLLYPFMRPRKLAWRFSGKRSSWPECAIAQAGNKLSWPFLHKIHLRITRLMYRMTQSRLKKNWQKRH